jgi:hypothetical protein
VSNVLTIAQQKWLYSRYPGLSTRLKPNEREAKRRSSTRSARKLFPGRSRF